MQLPYLLCLQQWHSTLWNDEWVLSCFLPFLQSPHPPTLSQEPGGNHTPPQLSPSVGQAAYTAGVPGGSLDVQHLIMQADARRRQRSNDNYFEDVPRSKLERQMAQVSMVRKGREQGGMNGGRQGEREMDSREVLWMVTEDIHFARWILKG